MSDQRPVDPAGEPDPAVSDALASMVPPPHGEAFWSAVDWQIAAQPPAGTASASPPPPPLPPSSPPLAEVAPLGPTPHRFPRWPAVAAAAAVVVLGAALVVRTSGDGVKTTETASSVPAETTALPTTTLALVPASTSTTAPTTSAPATTPKPTMAPSTTSPPATVPAALTALPEGLGPLRIGMTIKQTAATGDMGPYDDPLETGGACGYAKPAGTTYRADDFSAIFLNGKLARLYFYDPSRVRTPEGIGVGSASSSLRAVAGVRTESPHPYQLGTNVDVMRGNVGYQFTVDRGKVVEWSIGTAEALSLPEGCA